MCSINELRPWRKLALCLFGLLATPLTQADETRNYQVEVVVFENLDTTARQSEQWPSQSKLVLPTPLVELGSPADGKLGFRLLPASSFKLSQDAQQLADSHNYRILLHTAWRQPGLEQQVALPVHLTRTVLAETPQPGTTMTSTPPTVPPPANSKVLDGYLKLMLSKFLHAEIDLVYHDSGTAVPVPTTTSPPAVAPTAPLSPVYELKETRKMRSKELHYIDSPVLGVLIEITPLQ